MDLSSFEAAVFEPGVSRWNTEKTDTLNPQQARVFEHVINEMGRSSSKAQEIASPITTASKLRGSADIVYIMCDERGSTLQGFLRLGRKNLFLYTDDNALINEQHALCLLDFHVHESFQRRGIGRDLFIAALKAEESTPTEIAYDRPSPKLTPFLLKHFGLGNCIYQPNRFMVFQEFFRRNIRPRAA